jgi:hypothetical protein
MIIGNLWSVTDKDADKLTFKLLESLFEPNGELRPNPQLDLESLRQ